MPSRTDAQDLQQQVPTGALSRTSNETKGRVSSQPAHAIKSSTATNQPPVQNASQPPAQPWSSCRCMVIMGRIVAAFSVVTSNPIMHQQHRAMMVPRREEVKAVDLGTGDRIAHRFVVHLRTSGDCSRRTFTHSG